MTAPLFRHHLLSQQWVPWWWTGPNRGRVLWTIGLTLDLAAQWCQLGVLERFPLSCSEEALSWIGRDRGIRRGYAESSESYRRRLKHWRQTWARAGNAWAVLEQVQSYFLPEVPMVRYVKHSPALDRATWYTRDTLGVESYHTQSPSNWDWDSADATRPDSLDDKDSRFWIIVYPVPSAIMSFRGTTATVSPTHMRGTTALVNVGVDLYDLANTWKMAGSWCAGIVACWDKYGFDPAGSGTGYPDGTWHHYSRIASPSVRVRNRFAAAAYLQMRRHPDSFHVGLTSEIP